MPLSIVSTPKCAALATVIDSVSFVFLNFSSLTVVTREP